MPTHTDPDGDPRTAMSAKQKAAHDRGTKQARLAIVAIVVFMSLLAATRPLYGPYIDRFGIDNDQTMMERINHICNSLHSELRPCKAVYLRRSARIAGLSPQSYERSTFIPGGKYWDNRE